MKITKIILAATLSGAALCQPAFAKTGGETGVNAAASAGNAKAALAASARKHCLAMEPSTGSRISIRSCRTKAEWEAAGYDIQEKK